MLKAGSPNLNKTAIYWAGQSPPEVHASIRARYAERLTELAAAVDAERLEQEVALILQRMDVAKLSG